MKMSTVWANVTQIKPLTDSILQLVLTPKRYIPYKAGQYLQIVLGTQTLSYSIANAPLGSRTYELHIRHSKDNALHRSLLNDIQATGKVRLNVPLGVCELSKLDMQKPILFIAAGTGFAPIKAMIEQLLANTDERVFELFWGARAQNDLYMDDMVLQWEAHVAHFCYFSQLSATNKNTLVSKVLSKHEQELSKWQVVLSGPFDMVYHMRDELIAHGANPAYLFSDAFAFEKST